MSKYDNDLLKLPFYKNHAYMLPFVGDDYDLSKHKKLLLVGDSHYMPDGTIVHHDVSTWYMNPTVIHNSKEENNCATRKTWGVWRNTTFCNRVQETMDLATGKRDAWKSVAFYNYFLRPADESEQNMQKFWSKHGGEKDDREYAIKNLVDVIGILKPNLIVFMSRLVKDCVEGVFDDKGKRNSRYPGDYWRCFKQDFWDWTKGKNIDYIYTNHPSEPCWFITMEKYAKAEGKRSCDFFKEWLCTNW
ncbi:hypothetical protein Fisuc_0312 [Fibrobacter succinogenes subsp. succinogenes S85]|uniref:Uncharacterized protein n=1 Tax=Fibrobacter succinogenes (strain ATCC 19169 / S85) TaxID=59374 RepID=A0ABM5LEQ3_FIBSS|nr:hypothetical protein [Fibrobacter succinogenes]ACX73924.1 hypothetical protein Fisuc_0312 [Fibrobacter succinogenes subsp. succinogenes S85]